MVERQRRTHLLLIFVVAVFAAAWLPLNVFHLNNTFTIVRGSYKVHKMQDSVFNVTIFSICHVVGMFSACLNPLFYAFFNHNFRQEFVAMFDRVGFRSVVAFLMKLIRGHNEATCRVLRQAIARIETSTNAMRTGRPSPCPPRTNGATATFEQLMVTADRCEDEEDEDEEEDASRMNGCATPTPSLANLPIPVNTRIVHRQELNKTPADQLVVMVNTV